MTNIGEPRFADPRFRVYELFPRCAQFFYPVFVFDKNAVAENTRSLSVVQAMLWLGGGD